MRVYNYDPKVYFRKVTFVGMFCLLLVLVSAFQILRGENFWIWIAVLIIAGYTAWNDFISFSNPSQVTIDDDGIVFTSYGHDIHYSWPELKQLRVKEFVTSRKLYIRVNKPTIFSGRYWIPCFYFNDTEELYRFFVDKEYEMHPDTLKAYARRSNEASFYARKAQKSAKAAEAAERQIKNSVNEPGKIMKNATTSTKSKKGH